MTRPFNRQTKRLSKIISHLGQALGGQAAARLSVHLKMPRSRHRILRQQFLPPTELIHALGVDDWAKNVDKTMGRFWLIWVDIALLTCYQIVQFLKAKGLSQRRIARLLNLSRSTVRHFYDAKQFPEREQGIRPSILDPFIDYLERQMQAGDAAARQLWQELLERGYAGGKSQVVKWLSQYRRRDSGLPQPGSQWPKPAVPRDLLKTSDGKPESLSKEDSYLLKTLLSHDVLQSLHSLVQNFASMLRKRETESLDSWITRCTSSEFKACRHFATTLLQDYEAVRAAFSLDWSNGQTQGQVHRLKLLKC